MSLQLQIEAISGSARRGTLALPHGAVAVPAFMPVGTAGSVKAVSQDLLEKLDAQIILANTYHLYLRPGHELVRRMGGLHRFISWSRPILTDSGGFQVFSLNELRKVTEEGVRFRSHLDGSTHFFSPEHSIAVQRALGADIIMAFDECTEYPATHARARESLDLTLRWAQRSRDAFHSQPSWEDVAARGLPRAGGLFEDEAAATVGDGLEGGKAGWDRAGASSISNQSCSGQSLFGIVQGGTYHDLRRESAERMVELDFAGYALGGLSVGEPRNLTRDIIEATLPLLPSDKPRYVMGVGYPEEIVEYAALGADMMDCVLPTRAARHGLLFTSEGRVNIKNQRYSEDQGPPDPECGCAVCRRYSRAYLRHLFAAREPLAATLNTVHNLAFYLDTMRSVRDAISMGNLPGLLARVRARNGHCEAD